MDGGTRKRREDGWVDGLKEGDDEGRMSERRVGDGGRVKDEWRGVMKEEVEGRGGGMGGGGIRERGRCGAMDREKEG